MTAKHLLLAALTLLTLSTTPAAADDPYTVRTPDNRAYRSNELFRAFENYYAPQVRQLRQTYRLDRIVAAESDEFRRIMLLRHWIHTAMPIDDRDTTPTPKSALPILAAAQAGGKFDCTQFAIVQNAVLNSFGYVTRTIGVGPGRNPTGIDGHHAANEVWVDPLQKWVMVDAKYDLHFEKNGRPLSALEIRDEVWRNDARAVTPAFGPDRKPTVPQIDDRDWGIWATPQNYRWVSWNLNTNSFTAYPADALSSVLVMFDDAIFRNHIWYRDGKPFWAYGTPFLIKTTRRDWIYWTPNTITSRAAVSGDTIRIRLDSFTPNFKTYQVQVDGQPWRDCPPRFDLTPQKTDHRLVFRAVNRFGVTGPEHHVEIDKNPQ